MQRTTATRRLLTLMTIGAAAGTLATSPASADVSVTGPGNSRGVAACKNISLEYPYLLNIYGPGEQVVTPITIKNFGACVSAFAQKQDWVIATASPS